jgi:hypothetical protein
MSEAEKFARDWGPFRAEHNPPGYSCVYAGDNDPICDCNFSNAAHEMRPQDYAEAIVKGLNVLGGHNAEQPAPPPARVVANWAKRTGPFSFYRSWHGTAGVARSNGPMTMEIGSVQEVAALVAHLNALGGHGETELPTLDDLARQQGVGPCDDPAALVVPGIENEVAPHEESCENCRWGPVTAYGEPCKHCILRPGRESAWEKKAEGGAE